MVLWTGLLHANPTVPGYSQANRTTAAYCGLERPCAIRISLAGSYSPISLSAFEEPVRWTPAQWRWMLATAGILLFFSVLWVEIIRRRSRQKTTLLREWARREAELKKKYHELFENANDIIFTTDLAGSLTSINKAGERVTGLNRGEALGENIYKFVAPEYRKLVRSMIEQKLEDNAPTTFNLRGLTKDGREIPLEVNSRIILEDGKPVGVQGIARDITERIEAEEAVRKSEERVRLLLESAAEGIIGLDGDGHCTLCNSASLRLLGYANAGELLGKNIHSLIHHSRSDGRKFPAEECPILGTYHRGVGSHVDTEAFWRADGTSFPVEYWSYPIKRDGQVVGSVVSFMDITERKALEFKLAVRERSLNSFFAAAPAGLAILDSHLRFVQINETMAQINGLSAAECIGKTVRGLLPKLASAVEPSLQRVVDSGKPMLNIGIKGETVSQPGVMRYWMVSYFPIPGLDEQTSNVAMIVIEVTDRKRAEDALRESEDRLNSILGSLRDVVWSIAPDTHRILYLNPAAESVYGRNISEFFENQKLWLDAVYFADRERVKTSWARLLVSGTADQEYRIVRPDGAIRWLHDRSRVIRGPRGAVIRLHGIQTDVTQRKQAEENLKRYRQIFANTNEAVAILDTQGRFLEQNGAHQKLLGFSDHQLQNVTPAIIFGEDLYTEISDQLAHSGSFHGEAAVRARSGKTVNIELSVMPVTGNNGETLCHAALIRDITERKRVEEERLKATEAAEAANRAKGEFLANMSHEIRTPLNGILGMTELALNTDLTEEQKEYLAMVKTSGESLLTVINDILDFSKIEAGWLDLNPIDFDLRDTLGDTLKTLSLRAHQKGLELTLHVAPEVPYRVVGDPTRLRQIIVNLVGNGIKFTEHGEVVLHVAAEPQAGADFLLQFTVTDTGMGIPEEKQAIIFAPFTQADSSATRKYGGTGLGLAISLQLVELMGGRLWVESQVGKGSNFHFNMRVSVSKEPAKRIVPAQIAKLRGMAVLVVDDNATNRRVLEEMLVGWGMKPAMADGGWTGLTAMEHAKSTGKAFPLVLIDAQMPDLDGFSLAQRIKQDPGLTGATIMMLTSAGRRGDAARCRALGISAYLHKPIKESDLMQAVLLALGRAGRDIQAEDLITRHTLRERRQNLRVLLAEDNLVSRELAERMLTKTGHKVTAVCNGREALDTLQQLGFNTFDVILMDVQMPELNGLEATIAIRKKEQETGTHLPIVAMTAHAMKGDRTRFLEAGMDAYIAKPVQSQELIKIIEETLLSANKTHEEHAPVEEKKNAVDWGHALARLDGDRELFYDLARLFAHETPSLLEKLRDAVDRGDAPGIERGAHTMKGSVSNFGAAQASDVASRLEQMAREGNLSQARKTFHDLEKEVRHVLSAMEALQKEVAG